MNKPVNPIPASINLGPFEALSLGGNRRAWMKVLPAGRFQARDGRGPWTTGDLKSMQAIVDRTLKLAGGVELMVDYDHQAKFGAKDGVGGRAPAAGWIKQLDARPDGIWAEIEWTDKAYGAIKVGEYRYLSPLFSADKKGNVTLLLNVALVNMPALDLAAIAASLNPTDESEPMDKILKALGVAEGTSEDAVVSALNALTGLRAMIVVALGLKADASNDDISKLLKSNKDERAKIAEALNLKPEAKGEEIVAAAAKLAASDGGVSSDEPDPAKFVPIESFNALKSDFDTLNRSVTTGRAEAAVEAALKAGKIYPAQREWALSLYQSDEAKFNQYLETAVPLTASQMRATDRTPRAKLTALTTEQRAVATALNISTEDYLKTLQDEQEQENA